METDNSLVCFKAISDFVTELGQLFSKKQKSLKCYVRLISKTTLCNEKPINKHIKAFKKFCANNRDAVMIKNSKQLVDNKISYSDNVYIDMTEIFKLADQETTEVIWKHILYINSLVDPSEEIKKILDETLSKGKTGTKEVNFIKSLTEKMSKIKMDDNADISALTNSGILPDMMASVTSGLSDGSLDIRNMLGAIQSMTQTLAGDDPQAQGIIGMMSSMIESGLGQLDQGRNTEIEMAEIDKPEIEVIDNKE